MRANNKKFVSVNKTLVIIIVLISTCVTAVSTLINIYIDYKNEKEIQNLTLHQVKYSSLSSITEAVWQLDSQQIEKNLNGILANHDIIAIQLTDSKSKVLFERSKNVDSDADKYAFNRFFKLDYPSENYSERLGVLKVRVTNYFLYERMLKKIFVFFLSQGLKTFIISFIMLSVFGYFVTRHLNALVSHILSQRVTDDSKLIPFEQKDNDSDKENEIDVLIRSYNELVQIVNKGFDDQQTIYELILDSAGEGIVYLNSRGVVNYINSAGAKMIGVNIDEVIGQPLAQILNVHESELLKRLYQRSVAELFVQDSAAKDFEFEFRRVDGTIFPVECTGSLIPRGENRDEGSVLVYRDVSVSKKVQEDLLKSKEIAENALEIKARFLANVSHEIRTPLNGIIGFSDLLMEESLPIHVRENIKIINECANSLLFVINDLLDYSKLESGYLKLVNIEFDLEHLLESSLKMFKKVISDKNLQMTFSLDKKVPRLIKSDPDRLKQIIINVVNNAIKFTDKGFVRLDVSVKSENDRGVELLFAIKDTGVGIPKEKLKNLFHRFTQVDDSTTRKYGGTGLGLAICKNLIHLFGGQIWAESEENLGSSFYFSINVEPVFVKEAL